MPDVFTKQKRSEVMARIRSRGNKKTELAMVALFRAHGITGWRRQRKLRIAESGLRKEKTDAVVVSVDFVFPKQHVALFVDGCFWHGCARHCRIPATRRAFWSAKILRNRTRDRLVTRSLRAAGWRVLRVWEHELARRNEARLLRRLRVSGRLFPACRTR